MDFGSFTGFWRRLAETRLHTHEELPVEVILSRLLPAWRSCVICHSLRERFFDFVSHWQYVLSQACEGQAEFLEGQTWCNRHAWFFEKMAAPLTLAALHRGLLSRVEARIGEVLDGKLAALADAGAAGILRILTGERACPLCEDEAAFQEALLHEVTHGLATGTLRDAFAASGGSCLPHLAILLHRAPDPGTARWLLRTALDQARRLTQELDTFEAETANRTRRYGSTADAPLRAMICWAGLRGMVHEPEGRIRVPTPCGGKD